MTADTSFIQTQHPDYLHVQLDTVSSTNDFLHQYCPDAPQRIVLATAQFQTAGRGATGGWESEAGKNVVFSLLTHPTMVPPSQMFVLSEVIALSVKEALEQYAQGFTIKWPNDIYHGNRKIVGMLIENDLCGKSVSNSIMGVGVNVNQTVFRSDAPNPSSLALICDRQFDCRQVMQDIISRFVHYYNMVEQEQFEAIHAAYLPTLYRLGEEHTYQDASGKFRATLLTVQPSGHLVLLDTEGKQRRYEFKEVKYII